MKRWNFIYVFVLTAVLYSCQNEDKLTGIVIVDSEFQTNTNGWRADFAEYAAATDSVSLERAFARARLPIPLDTTKYGFRIQSHNRSDDMFMFLKKRINGFIPEATYLVTYEIDFVTMYPEGTPGAGGSPANSIYLKAGASPVEPAKLLTNGFYNFNLKKGAQSESGDEMLVLGNAANGIDSIAYRIVKRNNLTQPVTVKASDKGEIWLCVGTDSGFEGLSIFYYDRIKTVIKETNLR